MSAPWIIFLLWYLAPAFYGKWPSTTQEIILANCITIVSDMFAATFEQGLAQIKYPEPLKAVIIILIIASFCLFVIFTFKLPWTDLFAEPKWK